MNNKIVKRVKVIKGVKVTLLLISLWILSLVILSLLLVNRARHLQQIAADRTHISMSAVAKEVHGLRQEFTILRIELAPLLWLSTRMGGDLEVVKPLMDAGFESLVAADELLSVLTPSLGDIELSTISMEKFPQILGSLAMASPTLGSTETHLDVAAKALEGIEDPLSPRVEKWVTLVNRLVKLAQYGIGAAQIAPGLLGMDGTRIYLLLIQNSDELRPTGGFISAVGRIEISDGQLISMTVQDSYLIDDFTKEYPNPPQPLLDYMGSEQWLFRDSNWSPDFPETAKNAISLYQISRSEQVDGVIGINLQGIEMLMKGLEPLVVPELTEPVTSENITQILRESWNPSQDISGSSEAWWLWYSNRKQIIGTIMHTAINNLLAGKANWTELLLETIDSLNERQLLIYSIPEAEFLEQLGWDGALRPSLGDYLMIVDANVGFNKTNILVSKDLKYQVTLLKNGAGQAVVEVNYTHRGTWKDVVCSQDISFDNTITYEKLINMCYYNYLRLVVPLGSDFLVATAHPVLGKYLLSGMRNDGKASSINDFSSDRMIIGQFFVVEYGKQLLTHFEYDLPLVSINSTGQYHYTLLMQKQSGTDAMPVNVTLILPAQAKLISSNPKPTILSGGELIFVLQLDTDQQIEVIYALAP